MKDCPDHRKLSFTQEPDNELVQHFNVGNLLLHADPLGNQISEEFVVEPNASGNIGIPLNSAADKPELTCISEEGIADMDLHNNLFNDFDYLGDSITSCNKVLIHNLLIHIIYNRISSPNWLCSIQGGTVSHVERIWKQYQCWFIIYK